MVRVSRETGTRINSSQNDLVRVLGGWYDLNMFILEADNVLLPVV